VPEEVVQLIASKVDSNMRELEGALIKVDALSQTRGGKIDLDLAYEALTGEASRRINIPEIVDAVTGRFGVKRADLLGKKRHKSIAHPRQICMYLARELTPLSLEEIGGYFGGRDHTTVLYAIRRVAEQRREDPGFNYAVEELIEHVRHRPRNGE
jgi:chromosomal replication initiator protein